LDLDRLPDHGARRRARRQRSPLPVCLEKRISGGGSKGMRIAWAVGIFLALVALLAAGLRLNPREVPSPLIGKPAPAFELPLLDAPDKTFSQKDMLGKAWVLNVWASWCGPCLEEHAVITRLSKSGVAPVVGLNYKDARSDALPWLKRNG